MCPMYVHMHTHIHVSSLTRISNNDWIGLRVFAQHE